MSYGPEAVDLGSQLFGREDCEISRQVSRVTRGEVEVVTRHTDVTCVGQFAALLPPSGANQRLVKIRFRRPGAANYVM